MAMSCFAARSESTCATSSMRLLRFSSTLWLFTNGSSSTRSMLVGDDLGLEVGRQLPEHGAAFLVGCHQLAGGRTRRGQEQPAVEVGGRDVEMQPGGQNAAAQLVGIVLQRNDQDAGALEYVLAGQVTACCERERLGVAHRGLADATVSE